MKRVYSVLYKAKGAKLPLRTIVKARDSKEARKKASVYGNVLELKPQHA